MAAYFFSRAIIVIEKAKGRRKCVRIEDEEWEKSLDEHRSKDKQHRESMETLCIGIPHDSAPLTVVSY